MCVIKYGRVSADLTHWDLEMWLAVLVFELLHLVTADVAFVAPVQNPVLHTGSNLRSAPVVPEVISGFQKQADYLYRGTSRVKDA